MAEPGALSRGHVRAKLVADLALDAVPRARLAEEYGVSPSAVSAFAKRHHLDIARARERIEDRYAVLWVSDKLARLAEYQAQIERVLELVTNPETAARAGVGIAETERVIQTALRGVAEELGDLPSRTTITHDGAVTCRYELVGVPDLSVLS